MEFQVPPPQKSLPHEIKRQNNVALFFHFIGVARLPESYKEITRQIATEDAIGSLCFICGLIFD